MLRCFDFPISNISGQQHTGGETARGREEAQQAASWEGPGVGDGWDWSEGSAAEIRGGPKWSSVQGRVNGWWTWAGQYRKAGMYGVHLSCVEGGQPLIRCAAGGQPGSPAVWGVRASWGAQVLDITQGGAASAGKEKRPERNKAWEIHVRHHGRREMGKRKLFGRRSCTGEENALRGRWHRSWSQANWAFEVRHGVCSTLLWQADCSGWGLWRPLSPSLGANRAAFWTKVREDDKGDLGTAGWMITPTLTPI